MSRLIYILLVIVALFLSSIIYHGIVKSKQEQDLKINRTMQIEILNGCGVDGLGMKVRNVVLKKGFDVVRVGNARQRDFTETVVLERSDEKLTNAKHFARQFGIKNIGQDIDKSLYLSVTVIVGQDYKKVFRGVEKEL
ncbi:MAG: LytR C-terminal domain-containing protein [candidate division WOR-3 bacterium]